MTYAELAERDGFGPDDTLPANVFIVSLDAPTTSRYGRHLIGARTVLSVTPVGGMTPRSIDIIRNTPQSTYIYPWVDVMLPRGSVVTSIAGYYDISFQRDWNVPRGEDV